MMPWSRTSIVLSAVGLCACGADPTTAPDSGGETPFTSVSAGGDHSCALDELGTAFCWGSNAHAQVGSSIADPVAQSTPVASAGSMRFGALEAGGRHTCGLTHEGAAFCWGDDRSGQLGGGTRSPTGSSSSPVAVVGGLSFSRLSLGGGHTCALDQDGRAYCWGLNRFGQLGDGSTESTAEPVPVAGSLRFSSLDAGAVHTCGLTELGDAHCWGYNKWSQLGNNASDEMCGVSRCGTRPVLIAGIPTLASLNAGGLQSCGLTADGTAYCWGANLAGELGNAAVSELHSPTPVEVETTIGFGAVTGGEHSECAIDSGGAAYCWGSNSHGQLGDGRLGTGGPTPVRVLTDRRFVGVSAGMFHNCGTTRLGSILCWGGNRAGQLGTGTTAPSASPTLVVWPVPGP